MNRGAKNKKNKLIEHVWSSKLNYICVVKEKSQMFSFLQTSHFFLKHEFPSYTTHAPLPFSCSRCLYLSLPCPTPPYSSRPSSHPFSCSCFPFLFFFFLLSWNRRFPHDSLFHQPKPDRRGKEVKCLCVLWLCVSLSGCEAAFPRGALLTLVGEPYISIETW